MDQLPQELLRIIANDDSLSREDLHHLRLVNRPLAAASAPPLFHTISLWLGLSELKTPDLHVRAPSAVPVRQRDHVLPSQDTRK